MFLFVSRLDKGLLEATSNHLGPSWAQSGIKMAQHGSRLLQEGVVGSRHKQKVNIPMVFLMILKVNSRPCRGLVGSTLAQSLKILGFF